MLITFDVKGLEVVTAAYLSQCPVLYQEILEGRDLHEDNRVRFNLKDRDTSKRFKFKMIYGGTSHGFVSDPMFQHLNYKRKEWEEIINGYFDKYYGLRAWHKDLVQSAIDTGIYESPSGRTYNYADLIKKYQDWFYIPKIKNYPVQGFGADIVMVARISLYRRLKKAKAKSLLVNTIHDSIILDCPLDEIRGVDRHGNPCYNIITEVDKVFEDLPSNLNKAFDINFNLPLIVEHKQLNGESIDVCHLS